jgi:rhodanese-related sulfurtransferase
MRYLRFAAVSLLGSSLWVGAALLAGVLLKPQITRLLPRLAGIGGTVAVLILVLLAAYISFKWWERRRFYAALDMARISVEELYDQMQGEPPPVVVDVRSVTAQGPEVRRIPGALHLPVHEVAEQVGSLPRDREIVLYCNCPNEASAAQAARVLFSHGFQRVRPLRGGLDAWIAAGYEVEDSVAARASVDPPATPTATDEATSSLRPQS